MKKIKLLFCSSLFIFSFSFSYSQSWLWGKQGIGGTKGNDFGSAVATDKYGNAYIAKQFISQISFGPDTLRGPAEDNMYFVKYNSAGLIQWAVCPHQSYIAQTIVTSLATDTTGNIIITGYFQDTVKFGSTTLFGTSVCAFIVKYNSSGNVLWAKQSSAGNPLPYSVATDEKGNSYIAGYYIGLAVFGSNVLEFSGSADAVFLIKYDVNGNIVWAVQSTFPTNLCAGYGESVCTDKFDNVYLTGNFTDSIRFGTNSLNGIVNHSSANIFLAKYDSNGNAKWAIQANTLSASAYGEGYGVTTDQSGNAYIAGYFTDTLTFGSITLTANHDSTVFVAKYDSSGNFNWAEQTTNGPWIGLSLASDANDIYLGGLGSADTLTIGGNSIYNPGNNNSSFILKLNPSGSMVCGSILKNGGGTGMTYAGIASDLTGQYIYIAGSLHQDTIFCASDTLIAYRGGTAPYVARWQKCNEITGTESIETLNPSVSIFPNPNSGEFNILCHSEQSEESEPIIEIYNVMGEKVYTGILSPQTPKGALTEINISNQPNGIYFYRVIQQTGELVGEGKVIIDK
jgi:Secretion system C-terminal sorting domain